MSETWCWGKAFSIVTLVEHTDGRLAVQKVYGTGADPQVHVKAKLEALRHLGAEGKRTLLLLDAFACPHRAVEIALGGVHGALIDEWACGVVLQELLAGTRLWYQSSGLKERVSCLRHIVYLLELPRPDLTARWPACTQLPHLLKLRGQAAILSERPTAGWREPDAVGKELLSLLAVAPPQRQTALAVLAHTFFQAAFPEEANSSRSLLPPNWWCPAPAKSRKPRARRGHSPRQRHQHGIGALASIRRRRQARASGRGRGTEAQAAQQKTTARPRSKGEPRAKPMALLGAALPDPPRAPKQKAQNPPR